MAAKSNGKGNSDRVFHLRIPIKLFRKIRKEAGEGRRTIAAHARLLMEEALQAHEERSVNTSR